MDETLETTIVGDDGLGDDSTRGKLAPGCSLGRYVVMRELGSGAMGVVYQAYDPDLDRTVAVKRIKADGRGDVEEARQRLQREAQAMAKLQHPNVIVVHDVGVARGGLFVAMELVEGVTLRAWMKQHRGWREVVEVFLQAGRGLAAAHRAALVHRDFKPSNVLISNTGRVRVLDFGLVSTVSSSQMSNSPESEEPADDDLTRGGTILGTPGYMAPEQHRGRPADARSDIYAYCVALFEGLYGRRPFAGETLGALGRAKDAMDLVSTDESGVPASMRELVVRGLAVDPADRWPSMDALLEALEAGNAPRRSLPWLLGTVAVLGASGLAISSLSPPPAQPCADAERPVQDVWASAHRSRAEAAFLATEAPFADAAWAYLARTVDAYAADWAAARTEVCEATRVRKEQPDAVMRVRMVCLDHRLEELRTLVELAEAANANMVQRLPRVARRLGDVSRCRLLDEAGSGVSRPDDPDLRARGDDARGELARAKTLYEAGQYAQAAERSADVVASLEGADPAVAGEALYLLGSARDRMGQISEAEDTLHRSLYAAQQARDRVTQARAWTRLAWVVGSRLSRWDEGLRYAAHARAVADSLESDPIRTMGILATTGSIQFSAGRLDEALRLHRRALDVAEAALAPDDPRLAVPLLNLGLSHYAHRDLDEALALYRRALKIQEATHGGLHPRVATTVDDIGLALHARGDHDGARAMLQRALDIRREALGDGHRHTALTLRHLGDVALCEGALDEAERYYDQTTQAEEAAYEGEDRRRAFTLVRRGRLALRKQDPVAAKALFQRALAMNLAFVPEDHVELAFPLTGLGEAELLLGSPGIAQRHLERAAELRQEHRDPVLRAETDFALARALAAQDDWERVSGLAEAAVRGFQAATDPNRDRAEDVRTWVRDAHRDL